MSFAWVYHWHSCLTHASPPVLVLYDPDANDRNIADFYHIQHARELPQSAPQVQHSLTATRILGQLSQTKPVGTSTTTHTTIASTTPNDSPFPFEVLVQDVTGVEYTTGRGAASLTSTATPISRDAGPRCATAEEIRQAQFRLMQSRQRKGYVRLETTLGALTLELHAEIVPQTCANFLGLCRTNQYAGTVFHRLIPSFMIQGGKAKEGEDASFWGEAFADEFDDRLTHTGAGVLSMANAGSGTNRQQFFLTFKSCPHLDRKHSVFGKVVDGMDVLKAMERVGNDKKDKPKQKIEILGTEILVDPAKEAEDLERERLQALADARSKKSKAKSTVKRPKADGEDSSSTPSSVGKYLKSKNKTTASFSSSSSEVRPTSRLPPPPKKTKFNFNNW